MTLKLVQLAALPLALLAVAATVTPRHPQPAAASSDWLALAPGARREVTFFAAGVAPTTTVIDLATVVKPKAPPAGRHPMVHIVAELPDAAAAQRTGDALRASEKGVSVTTVGPLVIASGSPDSGHDDGPHPLARRLDSLGAHVLPAADRGSAFPLLVDLVCDAPDDHSARRLAEAARHHLEAPPRFATRPPWHPRGISPTEARARATYGRAADTLRDVWRAVADSIGSSPDLQRLAALDETAHTRLRAALEALEADPEHDRVVLDELWRCLEGDADVLLELVPRSANARQLMGERMGALPPEERARPTLDGGELLVRLLDLPRGRARARGTRVELGALTLRDPGQELPRVLVWLRQGGCTTVRLAFVQGERALSEDD